MRASFPCSRAVIGLSRTLSCSHWLQEAFLTFTTVPSSYSEEDLTQTIVSRYGTIWTPRVKCTNMWLRSTKLGRLLTLKTTNTLKDMSLTLSSLTVVGTCSWWRRTRKIKSNLSWQIFPTQTVPKYVTFSGPKTIARLSEVAPLRRHFRMVRARSGCPRLMLSAFLATTLLLKRLKRPLEWINPTQKSHN